VEKMKNNQQAGSLNGTILVPFFVFSFCFCFVFRLRNCLRAQENSLAASRGCATVTMDVIWFLFILSLFPFSARRHSIIESTAKRQPSIMRHFPP
jgi:uncharacterized membrane protein